LIVSVLAVSSAYEYVIVFCPAHTRVIVPENSKIAKFMRSAAHIFFAQNLFLQA